MKEISVRIPPKVWQKINFYCQRVSGEMSVVGRVSQSDSELLVHDIYLLDQENTGASTEICAKALAKLEYDLYTPPKDGRKAKAWKKPEGTLNLWLHSHGNMEVFWSGTDYATIRQLGKHGWFLSIVINKKEEVLSCYYQKGDGFYPEVFADNLETVFEDLVDEKTVKAWEKDIGDKCKKPEPIKFTSKGTPLLGRTHVGKALFNKVEDMTGSEFMEGFRNTTSHQLEVPMTFYQEESKIPVEELEDWYSLYYDAYGIEPMDLQDLEDFFKGFDDMGQPH